MKRYTSWLAALALTAAAGSTFAQGARVGGDLDKPLNKRQKEGGATGHSVMSLNQNDGDNNVEVRIVDGKVESAKVNGKEVPAKRVRQSDNKIELLDADGEVVATFHVGRAPGGGNWFGRAGEPGQGSWWQAGEPGQFFFTPGETFAPPKVMLGINMSQPDEQQAEELEVSAEETILVSRVIEGLPADKAGLKEGDVIVKIAGKSPATPERLREVLKEKEAGDTIKVTVVREGDEKTLTIELAEYDQSKLGVTAMQIEPREMFRQGQQFPGMDEEARKAFEEAMKQWEKAPGPGGARAFRFENAPGGRGMVFRAPLEADGERLKERLADLDGRMAEIDRRLSELSERLERLTQTLERRGSERP